MKKHSATAFNTMKQKLKKMYPDYETAINELIAKELIQDIDYYIENGNLVFSEWYHRKRGSCCGNGCRHCPYDHENVI